MTLRIEFPVVLELCSPWSLPSSEAAAFGFDQRQARAGGKLCVPAAHFKGVVREAARQVLRACPEPDGHSLPEAPLDRLFGAPSKTGREPAPGALLFSSLVTKAEGKPGLCHRVEINEETGIAEAGHLLMIEMPFERGAIVPFEGKIILTDPNLQGVAEAVLDRAFACLHSIGGMKSVGFGRVKACALKPARKIAAASVAPVSDRLRLCYQIDRPFLVNANRVDNNLSVGDETVPGAAIKACLARHLSPDEAEALSACHIGHARRKGAAVLPLSLGVRGSGEKRDIVDGFACIPAATRFASDFKDGDLDLLKARFGGPGAPLRPVSRTRVAIDAETYSAKEHELFSQIALDPGSETWEGTVSSPDAAFLAKIMGILSAGVAGLGKTNAVIKATEISKAAEPALPDGAVRVVLQSEAVLLPQDLASRDPYPAYEAYFERLGLSLGRFFASHALRGGYLGERYRAHPDHPYQPWLTTRAGSVFELTARAGGAALREALSQGLPPNHPNQNDWRAFPFMRQNGFGEIALWEMVP